MTVPGGGPGRPTVLEAEGLMTGCGKHSQGQVNSQHAGPPRYACRVSNTLPGLSTGLRPLSLEGVVNVVNLPPQALYL
jgi:hypothetical protein